MVDERPFEVEAALSGGYPIEQMDRMVRQLRPLIELDHPARVSLDLSRLVNVCPAALALLTATTLRLVREELLINGSRVVEPRSPLTAAYLQRMDFVRLIAGEQEEPFERHEAVGFRPVRTFGTEQEYPEVCASLAEALAERLKTDQISKFSVTIALDELAENVVQHAESPVGGIAAAQGYPRKRKFEMAIVDLGIGIRASLAKNPNYVDVPDDVSAINLALEKYVTATPDRNGGTGLFVTRLLLERNGGILAIRSGNGAVFTGADERSVVRETNFPGTMIAIRARTDHPLDINEIFDAEFPLDDN